MPSPSKALFWASLLLLVFFIPFTSMAIPVITQEFARSPTPTQADSSKMTRNVAFDIGFAITLFLFVFGSLAWVGGFSSLPFAVVDWLADIFRSIIEALPPFRLRDYFQRAADAIVEDADGARAAPQTHDGDTFIPALTTSPPPTPTTSPPPPPPTTSPPPPTQSTEPEGSTATHRCTSSASDDSHSTIPSSA